MKSFVRLALLFPSICLALVGVAVAQAQTTDGKPKFNASVADKGIGVKGGPLFLRIQAAFAAANKGNGAAFRQYLTSNPDLKFSYFVDSEIKKGPFTSQFVRAATSSCMGPYAVDEGTTWVQLSWVCRVDEKTPISQFLKFRRSSELGLTAWFENGRIKQIIANEPLPVPMKRFVPLDAYDMLKGADRG